MLSSGNFPPWEGMRRTRGGTSETVREFASGNSMEVLTKTVAKIRLYADYSPRITVVTSAHFIVLLWSEVLCMRRLLLERALGIRRMASLMREPRFANMFQDNAGPLTSVPKVRQPINKTEGMGKG